MESCPAQAVLPWVGLAAEKVIHDRYIRRKTLEGDELRPLAACVTFCRAAV
ncbi:MAG: hypothetical protein R6U98_36260 [Pirellulaceae bacterium]